MRNLVLGLVLLLALGDSCSNGIVGVQDYGSVNGRVLDATTNKPVPNAIISVGSIYTASADNQGGFTMPRIPIGLQQVTARAPGFSTVSVNARIHKDRTTPLGYLRVVPLAAPADVPTLMPPPTPTAAPTVIETYTPPEASESASPEGSTAPLTAAPSPSPSPSPSST